MKRLILILSFFLTVTIGLSSCKEKEEKVKDWTCECTYNGVSQSATIQYATLADATTACEAESVMGVTCKIK